MNIEILNVRFNNLARKLLEDVIENVSYSIVTEKKTDNKKLAKKTLTNLLLECGKNNMEIEIRHDMSGAPIVEFHDSKSLVYHSVPMISLTDELGVSSCFALLNKNINNEKGIVGIGIDLANIEELSGVLNISNKRFARFWGRTEAEIISKLSREQAGVFITEQFSKREASFKSMSSIYNLYREKNRGEPLPVSFMDFKFSAEGKLIVQGMTADIYKREGLDIHVESFQYEGYIGTIAVCWKMSLNKGK